MTNGKILYLNGSSSAGKTTLARELQRILDEPYLYVAIDTFCGMMAARYLKVDAFLHIPDDPFYETLPKIDMLPTDFDALKDSVFLSLFLDTIVLLAL